MKTKAFDITEHPDTLEDIQEFLKEVDDTGDAADYAHHFQPQISPPF